MRRLILGIGGIILLNFYISAGTISGIVTDSTSGDPIDGASVIASSRTGGVTVADTVTSGTDGTYEALELAAGNYTIIISATDYQTFTQRNVAIDADTTIDAALVPIPPAIGVIGGTVTDSVSGDPIDGAMVIVSSGFGGSATADTVTTGADGTYEVTELAAGNYTVTISATDYRNFSQRNVAVSADEITVDAALVVLPPAIGVIGGTVTDSVSGDPIDGAMVIVSSGFGGSATADTVTTGADGTYEVTELAAGNYTVTISATDYRNFSQRNVAVSADEITVDAALVVLPPAIGVIGGTVTDSVSGDPIDGAMVIVSFGFGRSATADTVTTGADGTYEVTELAAGNYTVTISATDYRNFSQRNVAVSADEITVDAALVALPPAIGVIGGTVTDSVSGDAIEGARIVVSMGFGGSATADTVITGVDGTYEVTELAAGNYTVTISMTDYRTFTQRNVAVNADEITVDAALVALPPSIGVIAGTVTDSASGDAIEGATVVVSMGFGGTATADTVTTGADGTYEVTELAAGNYTVRVTMQGYRTSIQRNVAVSADTVTADAALTASNLAVLNPLSLTQKANGIFVMNNQLFVNSTAKSAELRFFQINGSLIYKTVVKQGTTALHFPGKKSSGKPIMAVLKSDAKLYVNKILAP